MRTATLDPNITVMNQLVLMEKATDVVQQLPVARTSKAKSSKDIQEILKTIDRTIEKLVAFRADVARPEPQTVSPAKPVSGVTPLSASHDKAPAKNRVRETFDTLMANGQLLDSLSFQAGAQFTRQALSKAVKARRLFYLEVGGVQGYPAFYFESGLERKQIEAISKLLGDLSGGSKWLFFTQRSGFLALPETGEPQTPLDALRQGRFEKVKQAARGRAEA